MRAKKLHNYMQTRAAYEGHTHCLSVGFYEGGMQTGCRGFFGVRVDNKGNLLRDEENPEFWKLYKESTMKVKDERELAEAMLAYKEQVRESDEYKDFVEEVLQDIDKDYWDEEFKSDEWFEFLKEWEKE